jgi:SAM-dependent methyltransferase
MTRHQLTVAVRVGNRLQQEAMLRLQPLRRFTVGGQRYRYFAGRYNSAWHNERTVEVAIALNQINRQAGRRVLEVGNVLSHYVPCDHEVVDKYERGVRVRNVDVLEFRPDGRYDLIISVSTLEHVGWDEDLKEWDKPMRAVSHLVSLLSPGGTLLITLPLGYNPRVDAALQGDAFDLDHLTFLKRISRDNRWQEVTKDKILGTEYGRPFPAANVVAIGRRTR